MNERGDSDKDAAKDAVPDPPVAVPAAEVDGGRSPHVT